MMHDKKNVQAHFFYRYFQRWLKRRIPASSSHTLHRKNIFILPSTVGVSFLFTVILLWVLATNYQNNVVLLLSFLLLSVLHTCIFYTYANLSGVSIEVKRVTPCFAGGAIKVECMISARSSTKKPHTHHSIGVGWDTSSLFMIDVVDNDSQWVTLWLPAPTRGRYRAKRLIVMTRYPLGLMRAWATLDMDITAWVYPQPITSDLPQVQMVDTEAPQESSDRESQWSIAMNDDVSHLREYRAGDSLSHIAWKTYAKGQGLATKIYESVQESEQQQWLSWDHFSGLGVEERLSRLSDCVLQAEREKIHYGVILPNRIIPLGQGEKHQVAVLSALAMWGYDDASIVVNEGVSDDESHGVLNKGKV
jgi:uncharacterized protein (DUF58 family)